MGERLVVLIVATSEAGDGSLTLRALDGSRRSMRKELTAAGFDEGDEVVVVPASEYERLKERGSQAGSRV